MKLFGIVDQMMIWVGGFVTNSLTTTKNYSLFVLRVFKEIPQVYKNFHFVIEQMHVIGTSSIPLVAMTSVFTGGVVAIQFVTQFGDYLPLRYVGMVVGSTVMVDLGPVLTALVVTGRVGAAMAAELGTMAVTEQLDAMKCLNLNPYRFLMAPRFLAGMVMLPVLTIFSSLVAILGAMCILYFLKDVSPYTFFSGVRIFYSDWDLVVGLMKAFVFGFIIASSGCFYGFFSSHGAEGVGRATRASVVASDISILISGYAVSYFLLSKNLA